MGRSAIRRIVLTGPECTGKTTLAAQLAAELGAPLLTESARAHAVEVNRALDESDVERIAKRHVTAEDAKDAEVIVLDTDLLSTIVYARHYYNFHSEWIEREARARLGSLYLLCHPDVPWVNDGVRDRPTDREQMLDEFRGVLAEFGANVVDIRGLGDARIDAVRAAATT